MQIRPILVEEADRQSHDRGRAPDPEMVLGHARLGLGERVVERAVEVVRERREPSGRSQKAEAGLQRVCTVEEKNGRWDNACQLVRQGGEGPTADDMTDENTALRR